MNTQELTQLIDFLDKRERISKLHGIVLTAGLITLGVGCYYGSQIGGQWVMANQDQLMAIGLNLWALVTG